MGDEGKELLIFFSILIVVTIIVIGIIIYIPERSSDYVLWCVDKNGTEKPIVFKNVKAT